MASERTEDEKKSESERDEEERKEAAETTESAEAAPATSDAEDAEEGDDEDDGRPMNRAERRAAARRARRNIKDAAAKKADAARKVQVKLPPRTQTGKSSSDEAPPWMKAANEWLSNNRGTVAGSLLVLVLGLGGSLGFVAYRDARASRAAALLSEAITLEMAPIRAADAEDPPGSPPRRGPSFPDYQARSRAVLAAAQRVRNELPQSAVAPLARLTEASALYDLARYQEARQALEELLNGTNDLAGQRGRALETLGLSLEGLNDLPGALRRFEELGRLTDTALRDLATYHQARILHRQNQDPRAKELLRSLVQRLTATRADDDQGAASNSSVLEQAQILLRAIDPTDELGRRRAPGTEDGPMDLQRLLRQLQQQGRLRTSGGAPGGGAPAGGAPSGGTPGNAPTH